MADRPTSEDGPNGGSLHARIVADISERIASGAWPPGYRIPFEHELSADYGCSRMTVNKALSQLARAGLIERKRRLGSVVRQPRSQAAVLEIHEIRSEVEALGARYGYRLLRRVERHAERSDRAMLSTVGSGSVLAVDALHLADGKPFCFERRLIDLGTVPQAAAEAFSESSAGGWLIGHVPWSSAEHTIGAAGADAAEADALGIAAGTPCLVVERRTWTGGRSVTHVRLVYRAGTHALVARFTPGG